MKGFFYCVLDTLFDIDAELVKLRSNIFRGGVAMVRWQRCCGGSSVCYVVLYVAWSTRG